MKLPRKYYLVVGILIVLIDVATCLIGRSLVPPGKYLLRPEPWKTRGDPSSQSFLVEFMDYQCPFCQHIHPILKKLMKEYPKAKLIYKHYPIDSIHKRAVKAAEAAECAGDQGKFLEYHDLLFAKSDEWMKVEYGHYIYNFYHYARDLGLDEAAFKACLDSGAKEKIVFENKAEGQARYVNMVPTLLINGTRVITTTDENNFRKVFNELFHN